MGSSSWIIDQNNILHILINNSKSAWSAKIPVSCLNFLDNLLQDTSIIAQISVDNSEIAHTTYSVSVRENSSHVLILANDK